MDIEKLDKINYILEAVNTNGLSWKQGSDIIHLNKRKEKNHLPVDFTLQDYEKLILNIINDRNTDVFIYYVTGYLKDYVVFGDGEWIVIIGEDNIMETAFQIDGDYNEYLSKEKGYTYLGKLKELRF